MGEGVLWASVRGEMGGKQGSGRMRKLDVSGQAALPLNLPVATPSPSRIDNIKFLNPNPHSLCIGSSFLFDLMSHKNNQWIIDFRVILQELSWESFCQKYKPLGRNPYHPSVIVGLILLSHILGRTSLRQIEEMCQNDIRSWWISGGLMPDHTTFSKFMIKHQEDLTETTFEDMTKLILQKLKSHSRVVALDGTLVQSASSRYRVLKQEAIESLTKIYQEKLASEKVESEIQKIKSKIKNLQHANQELSRRNQERHDKGKEGQTKISIQDQDSYYQPLKDGCVALSYKPSIASNQDRIIVGHDVHPSSEQDQVFKIIEQAQRMTQNQIESVVADSNYNCGEVIDVMNHQSIELLSPNKKESSRMKGKEKTQIDKHCFVYHPEDDVYICPAGRRLTKNHVYKGNAKNQSYTMYKSINCEGCPFKDRCLSNPQKPRSIKRYSWDAQKEIIKSKMMLEENQKLYRKRSAWVEPVHGEQKNIQGMKRFRRITLNKVKMEYSIHCTSHNLRRYFILKSGLTHGQGVGSLGGPMPAQARPGRILAAPMTTNPARTRSTRRSWSPRYLAA